MSFGIALSGLDAAQSDLNVTANNIANASTTGFKSSNPQFAELFSVSPQGVSNTQIGDGVQLQAVQQQFSQGNIQTTGNSLDLALSGNGFFTVSSNGADQYTRAGSFQTNSQRRGRQFGRPVPAGVRADDDGGFNTTSLRQSADSDRRQRAGSDHHGDAWCSICRPNASRTDRRTVQSGECQQLQPVDLDDAVRLARRGPHRELLLRQHRRRQLECLRIHRRHRGEPDRCRRMTPVQLTYSNSGALTVPPTPPVATTPQRSVSALTPRPRARRR